MQKITAVIQQLSDKKFILLMSFLAVITAWRILYIQHGWINVDSLLYFESARLFSIGEFKQGVAVFNWPLYSLLISAVHSITGLSIHTSAQVLDVVFFAISTFSFSYLIKLAGGNKLTIACGVFLLLSTPYIVGDVLPMLLRDQGFWAALLTSLVFFVQYYRTQKISDALLWQVLTIVAMLFRIEGITFLIGLPFILWLRHDLSFKQKLRQYLLINSISILALLCMLAMLLLSSSVTLSDFGRIKEVISLASDVSHAFNLKAAMMGNVLGGYFEDYGLMALVAGLLSILLLKVASIISWPVIALYALNRNTCHRTQQDSARLPLQADTRIIFYGVGAITIINASASMARVFVLSNRYIVTIGFIALIFAAFCLASLINKLLTNTFNRPWQKWLTIALIVIFSASYIKNTLPKKAGYTFEKDAVAYVKQKNITNDRIFFVTDKTVFYAGANFNGRHSDHWQLTLDAIKNGSIYHYDYLMLYAEADENTHEQHKIISEQLSQYRLEKEFYGVNQKKKIMLYVKQ